MFYTVYEITNIINGKRYIGAHKTDNLDDGYMGSGKVLKRAIKKHGIESFTKRILHVFKTPEEMWSKEKELVVISESSYNINVGGYGGFDHINRNKLNGPGNPSKGGQITAKKYDKATKHEWAMKGLAASIGVFNPRFDGGKHKPKTKQQIGRASAIHQQGKGNSQYGTCWLTHPQEKRNLKVKKNQVQQYLEKGWVKGRINCNQYTNR